MVNILVLCGVEIEHMHNFDETWVSLCHRGTRKWKFVRKKANFNTKKLSCRKETARRFVSLNILLSHSKSLKIIGNDTVA